MSCSKLDFVLNKFHTKFYLRTNSKADIYVFEPGKFNPDIDNCVIFQDDLRQSHADHIQVFYALVCKKSVFCAGIFGTEKSVPHYFISVSADYLMFDKDGVIISVDYEKISNLISNLISNTKSNTNLSEESKISELMNLLFFLAYRAEFKVFDSFLKFLPNVLNIETIFKDVNCLKMKILDIALVQYYSMENFELLINLAMACDQDLVRRLFDEIVEYFGSYVFHQQKEKKDRIVEKLIQKANYLALTLCLCNVITN